jgi:Cft2 family RNA processing exonuclease
MSETHPRPRKRPTTPTRRATPTSGKTDVRITHFGGAGEVGATSYAVEVFGARLLVDAGMRLKGQTVAERSPAWDALKRPDLVLLTHGHFDHIGGLPLLLKRFPDVRVFATSETRDIATVILVDSARIGIAAESEGGRDVEPMYDTAEAIAAARAILELPPLTPLRTVIEGVRFEIRSYPVGHILGAVAYHVRAIHPELGEVRLALMGDMSGAVNVTVPALNPDHHSAFRPHVMVCESTYGTVNFAPIVTEREGLRRLIARTVRRGGHVVIPAFAVGRSQEIAALMRQWNDRWVAWCADNDRSYQLPVDRLDTALWATIKKNEMLPWVPCFLDGMARKITAIYESHPEFLNPDLLRRTKNASGPVFFNNDSNIHEMGHAHAKAWKNTPSVMVAPSGMMTGGLIMNHVADFGTDEDSTVAFSGYVDCEAPGARLQLLEHTPVDARQPFKMFKQNREEIELTIRAEVRSFRLRAHISGAETIALITACAPQHVVLAHGSREAATTVHRALRKALPKVAVASPENLETLTLRVKMDPAANRADDRVDPGLEPTTVMRVAYGVTAAAVDRAMRASPRRLHDPRDLAVAVLGVQESRAARDLAVNLIEEILVAYRSYLFDEVVQYQQRLYRPSDARGMRDYPLKLPSRALHEAWDGIRLPEFPAGIAIVRHLGRFPRVAYVGPSEHGRRRAIVALSPDAEIADADILAWVQDQPQPEWWHWQDRVDAQLRREVSDLHIQAAALLQREQGRVLGAFDDKDERQRRFERAVLARSATPVSVGAQRIITALGIAVGWMRTPPEVIAFQTGDLLTQVIGGKPSVDDDILRKDMRSLLGPVGEVRAALGMPPLAEIEPPIEFPFDVRAVWADITAQPTFPSWPREAPTALDRIAVLLHDCQVLAEPIVWAGVGLSLANIDAPIPLRPTASPALAR